MTQGEPAEAGTGREPDAGVEPFGMTDLEERLQGPDAAAVRQAALARLTALQTALAAELASGLRPQDYADAQLVARALAIARELMLRAGRNGFDE